MRKYRICPHCGSHRIITDTLIDVAENYKLGRAEYGVYCLDCRREFSCDYVIIWYAVKKIEELLCAQNAI